MKLKKSSFAASDAESEAEEDKGPQCVICVGSTGSGKSATIAKYTSLPIRSNAGSSRVTTKCTMYKRPQDQLAWIDTVGWDDAEFEDDETFKSILRYIDDNYLTRVKAIIWNVHPNVRRDALLCNQAKLIDKFAPKDIWSRVIVIVKQSMNPELDGQGALAAALDFHTGVTIPVLGYRFISDDTFTAQQRTKMLNDITAREAFNVVNDEEVRQMINERFEDLPSELLPIIFRSKKCVDCSQMGDERLLTKFCHMQSTMIHTGISEQCHPGFTEPYHSDSKEKNFHPGRLFKLPNGLGGGRYTCCYRKKLMRGCQGRWDCCGVTVGGTGCRTRYNCCQIDIAIAAKSVEEGCQKRYACCRGRMEDEGCTRVSLNIYYLFHSFKDAKLS